MTHQPPVPEAAQSPFPLQPKPHNDGAKLVATPAPPRGSQPLVSPALAQIAGIGAALIGSALLAWYFRRDRKPAPAPRKAAGKPRKSADPARVAAGQPYEVSYFARKHGLSAADARAIIKEAGPSRAKANQLVKDRKG